MKRLILILLTALLAAPAFAGRSNCTQALVDAGICRATGDKVWFLSMNDAADAKLQSALAKQAGWVAEVTCTAEMVALAQCTEQQIGTLVANPRTERNAARAEFRRMLKDEYIRSEDAEAIRAQYKEDLEAALGAITDPDLGQ